MKSLPEWVSMLLKLAGIANAFWGLTFTLFPETLFRWANMPDPQYLFPWKMIGAITVVLGVFYFIASFNPVRHFMIIGMGFQIKLIEAIFIWSYWARDILPLKLALFFSLKDLIWLLPFAVIIYLVLRVSHTLLEETPLSSPSLSAVLSRYRTAQGRNLNELSKEKPVLLIFLRHFECHSTHKALTEIREQYETIEKEGVEIIVVHMAAPSAATHVFQRYQLLGLDHISNPEGSLYQQFRLKKGSIRQVLDISSWKQHFEEGQSLNKLLGSALQMPGIFLIYQGELLKSYRYEHLSDRPDYIALATQESFPS